jgi:hypothetical protein
MYYKGIESDSTIKKLNFCKESLFFKPQGIDDYDLSVLLSRARNLFIYLSSCCLLPAPQPFERGRQAHMRHNCQSQNPD